MYGWRARIGLVVPTNNTVIEPEFYRMAPEGVSSHASRILSGGLAPEAIAEMVKNSTRAVRELGAGNVGVIGYACLATTLVKGLEWNDAFLAEIQEREQKPATTAASATVDALRYLKVSRVALATPYTDKVNQLLPRLFEPAGIEIVSLRSITVASSLEVCRLPPSVAYELAREADAPDAQAVCLLATDFRTIDVLDALERDLGKPVISTNQALMWRCLALGQVDVSVEGFGSLLRRAVPT